ncbi:glycosyltransferase [Enterovirga aerilata]|uniref:Glycosyltransferase family 4 protein n=1 Tax=Enterovirga aerilata TaxID=2730920 RepID=A0A849I2I7_9HYPH|nr:glycosyltransferase family 4 protein [Enterovirga sp. DB1703]
MSLTILSVAYPLAPVSPDAAGGAEQVLSMLDRAIVEAGHRSVVVAQEGSKIAGTLVPVPAVSGDLDEGAKARAHAATRAAIGSALARFPVDLVHLHGIDFHAYLPPPGPPVLATLHLPPSWYPAEALRPSRPDTWLHCVSDIQHAACSEGPRLLPAIPNGVDVEALQARHAKRGYAMVLGRICPEKGVHVALEAAKLAGVPLLVAGEVFPYDSHRRYFDEEVRPRLDRQRRFVGPIGFARKRRLLTAARCLLVPSLAPETSSLVAREAASCGTPVIAFPNGALSDAVEHERTGFLVHDVEAMAAAIHRAGEIDPETCRETARRRFSRHIMTAAYLDLYAKLAARRMALHGAA